jgi:hypothetical protein
MISLGPSLITEHHSVSSLDDPAREASPCSSGIQWLSKRSAPENRVGDSLPRNAICGRWSGTGRLGGRLRCARNRPCANGASRQNRCARCCAPALRPCRPLSEGSWALCSVTGTKNQFGVGNFSDFVPHSSQHTSRRTYNSSSGKPGEAPDNVPNVHLRNPPPESA